MTRFFPTNSPVSIFKNPTAADFPIEIQGYKIYSLFATGTQVSHISYSFYSNFIVKPEINT